MRPLFAIPLLAATLALAGCVGENREAADAATQAGLAKALAGLVPGKPTSCLPPQGPSGTDIQAYGSTLLYRVSNGEVYRNDTAGGCGGHGDDIFVTVEYQASACSGDIVRTIDRTSRIPTGSCGLRQFTPYLKPRK